MSSGIFSYEAPTSPLQKITRRSAPLHKTLIYDVVIVGGGIAGLYSAYRLLQKNPNTKLLLIEKQSDLGGRVFTYRDETMTVEAGAGRFAKSHTYLWKLLRELDLETKAVPISGGFSYIPTGNDGRVEDGPEKEIAEIVQASKRETRAYLQSVLFLDYAKRILGAKRANHIVHSFGYYSELVVMNAHDAIVLLQTLENETFYALSGGLSQIIEQLEKRIRSYPNVRILMDTKVEELLLPTKHTQNSVRLPGSKKTISTNATKKRRNGGGRNIRKTTPRLVRPETSVRKEYQFVLGDGSSVFSRSCIFAVPKQALEKLSAFRPVRPLLRYIACGSLCRIYSQFSTENMELIHKLYETKITTNNDLRMIIPIDEAKGTVMISYTDNKYADMWHEMEQTEDGIRSIDTKIAELVRDTLDISLPRPLKTKVFYWKCGVGYWKVGANSATISNRMIRPFPRHEVYVCGEHYSEKHQQWMEGALETSEKVIAKYSSRDETQVPFGAEGVRENSRERSSTEFELF
jgi:hypothetical protein